jgi:N6-L-threonylcarbamoyladenine synthase
MNVLGIETSCDETSVSVVKDGKIILSNEISSSLRFHKKYGGVVPEIASRMQLETITQVAQEAIKKAHISLKDIGVVSVTSGPGLSGSLLTGISFAKSISLAQDIPLLGINHVYSHIYANFLNQQAIELPFVALVVSGGHTSLFYIKDFDRIEILGETQDDACGEAFDKVAKILGLGYPGGPQIERLAVRVSAKKIKFSCSGTKKPLDFSFSGIKTAVLYYVKQHASGYSLQVRGRNKTSYDSKPAICDRQLIADIAASFQETVIDTLIKKSFLACRLKKVNRLGLGGGVVANNRLREKFFAAAKDANLKCYFPPKTLCADNAAMVAGLGYQLFKRGYKHDFYLNVQ